MEAARALATSFIAAELVVISLEDGGSFTLQQALLCHASEYFRKALDGSFLEGQNKTLTLPGCSTSTFQLFLHWLIKGDLPRSENRCEELATNLASLWVFADMLSIPRLQNQALESFDDAITHNIHSRVGRECRLGRTRSGPSKIPPVSAVQVVYANTSADSELRDYTTSKLAEACWCLGKKENENVPYTHEQKDELGCIPGLLDALISKTRDCVSHCDHGGHGDPFVKGDTLG